MFLREFLKIIRDDMSKKIQNFIQGMEKHQNEL